MRAEPRTIRILLKHGMACIGCPIAPFHSLEDVCHEYDLESGAFLRELSGALNERTE
ncbi:MAG: hydrid cluster protein-associated redox disulfide domain protein [Alphaproteobacteria bacterium]|nr:hydrid cluster protein-associated redox disulfide domain protein [Alphaproteobacteria bacterium]MDE2494670.1 hydrid cluster protein-associated redox disulfide domain protein [Alphaproteobacteria bacterium]